MYYGGDEEFVWVVVLRGWVAYVVIYEVDVLHVVFEFVYVVGDFWVLAKATIWHITWPVECFGSLGFFYNLDVVD